MSDAAKPGEVVLERASRSFALAPEHTWTIKEALLRRRRGAGGSVAALDEVTLRVAPGETVGLVGRNGAGKTSTLRCLAGIVPLDSGRAECGGRVVSLLELGAGFGPDFTGRENIYLNGALHGLGRRQVERHVDEIVEFSELGDFIDVPVKSYSAGMYLRLGFAIVAHLEPNVLLIDEILAVGDEAFQRKCLRRIAEHMESGATIILVSHDPFAIERVCERVVVLEGGRVAFDGPTAQGLLRYHELLASDEIDPIRDRVGRGPITVGDIELEDGSGRETRLFRTGESLRAAVELRERAATVHPRVAVEVRDEKARRVFRTERDVELRDGRARVGFELDALTLLAGDYDLMFATWDEGGDPDDAFDRMTSFSVSGRGEAQGLVDLGGRWRIGSDTEAVAR